MTDPKAEGFIRDFLSAPLKVCPSKGRVCPAYFEGCCYNSGKKQDPSQVQCDRGDTEVCTEGR